MFCWKRLRAVLFGLFILLAFAAPPPTSAAQAYPALTTRFSPEDAKIIPLLYDPLTCPLPLVQASVNGSAPLWFVVDTGASVPLTLEKWAVNKGEDQTRR